MTLHSVNDLFDRRLRESGQEPGLCYRTEKEWETLSWNEWGSRSNRVGHGLMKLGLDLGDRVGLLASTRWEWVVADIGILRAGGVTVPIYPTNTGEVCEHILRDSGTKILIVEDAEQLEKIGKIRDRLPDLSTVIVLDPSDDMPDWAQSFGVLLASGDAEMSPALTERGKGLREDSVLTIVYTSGTTGMPKGVVITHGNMLFETSAIREEVEFFPNDEQLLFLPLAHIFAKLIYMTSIEVGGSISMARSLESIVEDAGDRSPTFMGSVPRVYEKAFTKIRAGAEEAGGAKWKIFQWAVSVGTDASRHIQAGRSIPLLMRPQLAIANRLVFDKMRAAFGGRIRYFISGGAPLSRDLAEFFHAAGLLILEGYGLTETCGATHCNRPTNFKFGTVGEALPGVDVRIADDGEILVRGPNIMRGYYNNPEASAEAIDDDGWFRTGDIGEIESSGHLRITDRKKDIIVTAGGKNIAPQNLENRLKLDPYISNAMVHGDRRKFLSALITLDPDNVVTFAKERQIPTDDVAELSRHPLVRELIQGSIDDVNAGLASFESVKKFAILSRDFLVEENEITPTLKLRRKAITERNQSILDAFYEESF